MKDIDDLQEAASGVALSIATTLNDGYNAWVSDGRHQTLAKGADRKLANNVWAQFAPHINPLMHLYNTCLSQLLPIFLTSPFSPQHTTELVNAFSQSISWKNCLIDLPIHDPFSEGHDMWTMADIENHVTRTFKNKMDMIQKAWRDAPRDSAAELKATQDARELVQTIVKLKDRSVLDHKHVEKLLECHFDDCKKSMQRAHASINQALSNHTPQPIDVPTEVAIAPTLSAHTLKTVPEQTPENSQHSVLISSRTP